MKSVTYRAIIVPDGDGYHASVPALPGLHVYEETLEEIRKSLPQVIAAFVESMQEEGLTVPSDQSIETLETIQFNYA
jgi:predicted RNase H-like HicB family nuclease